MPKVVVPMRRLLTGARRRMPSHAMDIETKNVLSDLIELQLLHCLGSMDLLDVYFVVRAAIALQGANTQAFDQHIYHHFCDHINNYNYLTDLMILDTVLYDIPDHEEEILLKTPRTNDLVRKLLGEDEEESAEEEGLANEEEFEKEMNDFDNNMDGDYYEEEEVEAMENCRVDGNPPNVALLPTGVLGDDIGNGGGFGGKKLNANTIPLNFFDCTHIVFLIFLSGAGFGFGGVRLRGGVGVRGDCGGQGDGPNNVRGDAAAASENNLAVYVENQVVQTMQHQNINIANLRDMLSGHLTNRAQAAFNYLPLPQPPPPIASPAQPTTQPVSPAATPASIIACELLNLTKLHNLYVSSPGMEHLIPGVMNRITRLHNALNKAE